MRTNHSDNPQWTVRERAVYLQATASDTAAGLAFAAQSVNVREARILRALALRILKCNKLNNQYIIRNAIIRDTGEFIEEATGQLWRCDSKLCPRCLAHRARRNRRAIREAIMRQKPRRGERYRLLTLTMKNPSLPLLETRELINRAWTLFRKRLVCVSLIRGAVKSEEFTVTKRGYHYHIHALVLSKWLAQDEVQRVWSECVTSAVTERDPNGKPQIAIVDIRAIRSVHGKHAAVEAAIQEVSKYITKPDNFAEMDPEVLAAIGLVERWQRMHEMIGTFRNPPAATAAEPSLDTKCVNDGKRELNFADSEIPAADSPNYWRRQAERQTTEQYLANLELEIARAQRARIRQIEEYYVDAKLQTLAEV